LVEEIRHREASQRHAIAIHRPRTAELVHVAGDWLALCPETEILRNVETGQVRRRRGRADARQLAIGEIRDAGDAAETLAAGDLGIEVQRRSASEPQPEK